jgi:hypothetical protein
MFISETPRWNLVFEGLPQMFVDELNCGVTRSIIIPAVHKPHIEFY